MSLKQGKIIFFVIQHGSAMYCLKHRIIRKIYNQFDQVIFDIDVVHPKFCGCRAMAILKINNMYFCEVCGEREKKIMEGRGRKIKIEMLEEQTGFSDYLLLKPDIDSGRIKTQIPITEEDAKISRGEAIEWALGFQKTLVKSLQNMKVSG